MSVRPVAILATGLVTAVGMDAPSSNAAFRAKLTHPTATRFMDSTGEWILAHQVAPMEVRSGLPRLARMAAAVVEEALRGIPAREWPTIPLLLCVAEPERPGRAEGLDDRLFDALGALLDTRFAPESAVMAQGRVGVAVALSRARDLLRAGASRHVVIAAVDSLMDWRTLMHYDRADRLLRQDHSNGFMPGEGAGALLVGDATGEAQLLCTGLGFGRETAHIDSDEPLRADGLVAAIRAALAESGHAMGDFDFRIADVSGEQYYFKETALALSRTLKQPKAEFDLWHPAECTGEAGALAGAAILSLADAACRKGFARGPNIVAHLSDDGGQRAAMLLRFGVAA